MVSSYNIFRNISKDSIYLFLIIVLINILSLSTIFFDRSNAVINLFFITFTLLLYITITIFLQKNNHKIVEYFLIIFLFSMKHLRSADTDSVLYYLLDFKSDIFMNINASYFEIHVQFILLLNFYLSILIKKKYKLFGLLMLILLCLPKVFSMLFNEKMINYSFGDYIYSYYYSFDIQFIVIFLSINYKLDLHRLHKIILFFGLFIALLTLIDALLLIIPSYRDFIIHPVTHTYRSIYSLHEGQYSFVILLFYLINIFYFLSRKIHPFNISFFPIILILTCGVIMSGERIVLFIMLLVTFLLLFNKMSKYFIGFIVFVFLLNFNVDDLVIFGLDNDSFNFSSSFDRFFLLKSGFEIFKLNAFSGVGSGIIPYYMGIIDVDFGDFTSPILKTAANAIIEKDHLTLTHNLFFDKIIENGVTFFLICIPLFYKALRFFLNPLENYSNVVIFGIVIYFSYQSYPQCLYLLVFMVEFVFGKSFFLKSPANSIL
jgi:hypothetical protein